MTDQTPTPPPTTTDELATTAADLVVEAHRCSVSGDFSAAQVIALTSIAYSQAALARSSIHRERPMAFGSRAPR